MSKVPQDSMEANKYNKYRIQITDSKVRCIEANGEPANQFLVPDVSDSLSKLYVVKNGRDIYYVGITITDIRKRLRSGFYAKGEHGYYGYKWKDQETAEILIWCFPDFVKGQVEAIEGELVYLIRNRIGNWPTYQMEIHFHPNATDEEKQAAQSILYEVLD